MMKKITNFVLLTFTFSCICLSQGKTTIAVYNLQSTSILTQEEVEILTNHLRSILINYQKYDCLDRNRMDEILREQGFQQSGCTSEMCAVEAGQLLGVQKMLTGSVGKFGKLFTIELQIIDIETSKIGQSSTYYFEGEMEKLLTEGIKLSLEKLVGSEQIVKKTDKPIPEANIKKTEQIKLQEPDFGYIIFKIDPSNARVVIDDKVIPRYQMDNYKIIAGTYSIQISKKGYKNYIDVVSILEGKSIIITKSLEPEEKSIIVDSLKTTPNVSIYINGGPIEPWGNPGTGALFNTGMRVQGGAQLNIGNWVQLPLILQPLTAELMVGYGVWNIKNNYNYYTYYIGRYVDAKTNVISVLALGCYDITDLIMKAIGFKYPTLGIFGVAGLQYNMQSWDFPNWTREFDSVSSFGFDLGVGVKYNLQSMVGKLVEVDIRFTQGVFIMGDVKDQNGDPFYPNDDYHHTENGLLFGIKYPL